MNDIKLSTEQQACLQTVLKSSSNVHVYRRAAALLAMHEGRSVTEVATFLGVTRQSIYNWLLTYVQAGQSVELTDAPRAGRPSLWAEDWDALLQETLRRLPAELGYDVQFWNAGVLQDYLASHLGRRISGETLRRQLRRLGYVWKRGRYVLSPASGQHTAPHPASTPTLAMDERETVAA